MMAAMVRHAARTLRPPALLRDLAWAVRSRVNNRFRRRLAVLRRPPGVRPGRRRSPGLTVRRYGPADPLPPALLDRLCALFGANFARAQSDEAAAGATLWVAVLVPPATGEPDAGEPAGFARTRGGEAVRGWHVPLGPDDRLVYALATARRHRGRGVCAAVLAAALADGPPAGAAWADTMVWNAPALGVLRRAGFETVREADPLADHPD